MCRDSFSQSTGRTTEGMCGGVETESKRFRKTDFRSNSITAAIREAEGTHSCSEGVVLYFSVFDVSRIPE